MLNEVLFLRIFILIVELLAGLLFYFSFGSGYDLGFEHDIMIGVFLLLLTPITLKFGKISRMIVAVYIVLAIAFTGFYTSQIYAFREAEFKEKLNHDINFITETMSKDDPAKLIEKSEDIRHNLKIMDRYYTCEYGNITGKEKKDYIKTKKDCAFYDVVDKNQDAKYVYAYVLALYRVNDSLKDKPELKKYLEEEQAKKLQEGVDLRSAGFKTIGNKMISENYNYAREMYELMNNDDRKRAKTLLEYIPSTWDNELSPKVEEMKAYLK